MTEPFARVPRSVLEDPGLEISDVAVYSGIACFASANGACYPGVDAIIETLAGKVSRRTVVTSLHRLSSRGHIAIQPRRAGSRKSTNGYILTAFQCATAACATAACATDDILYVQRTTFSSISELDHIEQDQLPELVSLDPDAHLEDTKPKKLVGKKSKPEPLPAEQLAAFHETEAKLKAVADGAGVTWNPPREAKALRDLVTAYSAKLDRLPAVINTFLDLRRGKERFWQGTPPLPSALAARLQQVETNLASRAPQAAPTQRQEETCKHCGKPFQAGRFCMNPACPQYATQEAAV